MQQLFRTKPINADHHETETGLRRTLGALDLTLLGIGGIIGAGIFVLTGVAAATQAGPAIVVSYLIAGLACAMSALAYAELAAMIGGCGSAYGYAYASFGELVAWVIGWDLILEYGVATSAVAIGWSGYFMNALSAAGIELPAAVAHPPGAGGIINLPAAGIVVILTVLLALGVRESVRTNAVMVFIKLVAIAIFVVIAITNVNPANWRPFMPFGFSGTMQGAALIFFAYIGFDAVSTAADEARRPQRDLPIGILASLAVCTLIYVLVAGLLTGVAPYATLNSASPVAEVMLRLGYPWAAALVAAGAIAGLTSVMLVLMYGLSRVCLAMARDRLLPPLLADLHLRTRTPVRMILGLGLVMALIAGLTPIGDVAELVNIGTLAAFFLVCAGVLVLRYTRPDAPRPFRLPGSPFVPVIGAVACLWLMLSLPLITWIRFVVWLVLGAVVYFLYSRRHSALANGVAVTGQ